MALNNYLYTSVHKGRLPGFSGCIEDTSVISQLIRLAKINKKDLTLVCSALVKCIRNHPSQAGSHWSITIYLSILEEPSEVISMGLTCGLDYNNLAETTKSPSDW